MWQHMTGPRGTKTLAKMMPRVRMSFALSYQSETATSSYATLAHGCMTSATSSCMDYTDCTVSTIFFTCLAIRTDSDISLIRHLFEPKQVVLGS
jgi:hypothetical protein